jgi:hypothetical protein
MRNCLVGVDQEVASGRLARGWRALFGLKAPFAQAGYANRRPFLDLAHCDKFQATAPYTSATRGDVLVEEVAAAAKRLPASFGVSAKRGRGACVCGRSYFAP